jgi:acylphosphatase
MPTVHLEVSGRVQGVGFRWFVCEKGRALGLSGWVRNRPDGSVELAATGDASALERLRGEVKRGPRGAWVDQVRELSLDSVGDLPSPFAIVRG